MSNPIIPWMGGKRRLAKRILPLFPAHTCYVEPFSGGAALFFMRPEPAKVEVINDANGELVNLYRVIQHHLEEFIKQYKWSLMSRKMFEWLKKTPEDVLTDIQRAARFYYLQKLCFGGKVSSQTFGTATTTPPRFNLNRIEEELSLAHLRLARAYVENLDWEACIRKYDRPHTLFYCDPPYYKTAGYGLDFGLGQYEKMAALARSMKGKMLISVNDIPEMRRIFEGLSMTTTGVKYSVGGQTDKVSPELIFMNW